MWARMNYRLLRRVTVCWACAALIASIALAGCEYVRPTVNQPLKEWNPEYGYRFKNLAPPEEGNSDSLTDYGELFRRRRAGVCAGVRRAA